ncbi:hypothetical protein BaRGS_00004751, partial [Batillaria attramentaria]
GIRSPLAPDILLYPKLYMLHLYRIHQAIALIFIAANYASPQDADGVKTPKQPPHPTESNYTVRMK